MQDENPGGVDIGGGKEQDRGQFLYDPDIQ